MGRVEIQQSVLLKGAVPELGFAPSLPLRSQQPGSQDCTERWYPHPSGVSPGTDPAPLPPALQPGRGRRLTALCQACRSRARGGRFPPLFCCL